MGSTWHWSCRRPCISSEDPRIPHHGSQLWSLFSLFPHVLQHWSMKHREREMTSLIDLICDAIKNKLAALFTFIQGVVDCISCNHSNINGHTSRILLVFRSAKTPMLKIYTLVFYERVLIKKLSSLLIGADNPDCSLPPNCTCYKALCLESI